MAVEVAPGYRAQAPVEEGMPRPIAFQGEGSARGGHVGRVEQRGVGRRRDPQQEEGRSENAREPSALPADLQEIVADRGEDLDDLSRLYTARSVLDTALDKESVTRPYTPRDPADRNVKQSADDVT